MVARAVDIFNRVSPREETTETDNSTRRAPIYVPQTQAQPRSAQSQGMGNRANMIQRLSVPTTGNSGPLLINNAAFATIPAAATQSIYAFSDDPEDGGVTVQKVDAINDIPRAGQMILMYNNLNRVQSLPASTSSTFSFQAPVEGNAPTTQASKTTEPKKAAPEKKKRLIYNRKSDTPQSRTWKLWGNN